MTTEAPPQIPTPDLSITHGGNYVDLDPTGPVQDFPEHSAPEPSSAPAAEPTPQTNGSYKTAIVNCKFPYLLLRAHHLAPKLVA
ncbi:hypothetical protein UCDDS831_g04101 [Diplodia seriata]|uniref:Uncharacterized protein n=1 Tax=Diplodia seriata TaxID=420778 RepID=A0A0G2EI30_9PEZI|nr:hypothetical protein UCDDS831_g04101 [Diplodia seriata]